jgi:hypothetical protein
MFGRRNAVDELAGEFESWCMSPESWGSDIHTRAVEFYRRKERRLSDKDRARLRATGVARQTLAAATGDPPPRPRGTITAAIRRRGLTRRASTNHAPDPIRR